MLASRLIRINFRNLRQGTSVKQVTKTPQSKAYYAGVGFCGLTGVGGLTYSIYHALNPEASSSLQKVAIWPQYVKDRVQGTFSYCLGGIGVTTAAAMATLRTPFLMNLVGKNTLVSFIGCVALMMGSGMVCRSVKFDGSPFGAKAGLYYLHMGIVGAIIAPIAALGGPACIRAAWLTAGVMSGLSLSAMVAPNDAYLKTYGVINAGCGLMLAACMASFFANPVTMAGAGLQSFIIFGGLALFSLKGFSDIQRTVDQAQSTGEFDPIDHSLHITMDAINIFIRLVMILQGGKKK